MLRLPRLLGADAASTPKGPPYLRVAPRSLTADKFNVGICWAGSPAHGNDRNRSVSLNQLGPLAEIQSVRFHSLQKGPPAEQAKRPPAGMDLVDWSEALADMAETAALVSALDLVITVDTAVAHLAGALGKDCWILLPLVPDWRWLLNRTDSPWYPSARLFRQKTRGDWAEVVLEVRQELAKIREAGARRNTGLHNEAAQP